MKKKIRQQLNAEKQKIARRLEEAVGGMEPKPIGPEFSTAVPVYEMAERTRAISAGGLGAVHQLVNTIGLVSRLNDELNVLKQPKPYSDSDHVLNIAFNTLCGGQVLDDIEVRRNDRAFLDALGARAIPDPTTAGDYFRRFDADATWRLMDIINDTRVDVWQRQPASFTSETARIDVDGSLVPTTGECTEGMDISYKSVWGYHPLLVSLANTQEALFVTNRSGNRPSSEGAPEVLDRAIELCRRGGFDDILLRGDTDFSMTAHLDRWTQEGVRFVFGYDANPHFVDRAYNIGESEYAELERRAADVFSGEPRAKSRRVKEEIVKERGYLNKVLLCEDLAEFEHKPSKAQETYRIIVLRKTIDEERGQKCLDTYFRYFFYVTNDWTLTPEEVVAESNQRCNQENLIAQLKGGVRALHAPLNTLDANWAYMVMVSLAWNIKAWFALMLPITPRWREKHEDERELVLRMEFRTFLQELILVPAQILSTGRRIVFRFLAWRPRLPILFRLLTAL